MSPLPAPPNAGFFAEHTATELAEGLRAGSVSVVELTEHALREAQRLGPELGAFVTVDAAGARATAARLAEELAGGADRGPMHGIPVAVKDIVDTKGLRTTAGSRHFADRVPERDAECVRRLREAGAVIIGKATTHEFAYGSTGDRSANGPAHNPYRPGHMSGGSSGGSASAVAAGIVPVSVGSDTGGSVRIPACLCGLVGLRPTQGAVPLDGVFPLASSLDTVGPLARTAADCALLWRALYGGGPDSEGHPGGPEPAAARIGWVAPEQIFPTEPSVAGAARATLRRLTGFGATVDEVTVPEVNLLPEAYGILSGAEAYALHAERIAQAPEKFGEEVLSRLRTSGEVPAWRYVRSRELAARVGAEVDALFAEYDLLALPTSPITAPPIDTREQRVDGVTILSRLALMALTSPWSVLGLPAVSVPSGLVDGLPTGLQLVARPGAERLLLAAAARLADTDTDTDTPVGAGNDSGVATP